MTTPSSVSTKNFNGVFVSDKQSSDSTDELLRLQGMSWYKRRAVSICNLTLSIKHYTDDDGVERIDVDQKLSGGFSGGSDNHILDCQERRCNDDVFGQLIYKTRRVSLELIEDEFLKTGWTEDALADGVIHTVAWSDPEDRHSSYTWKAEQVYPMPADQLSLTSLSIQIWGFQLVDGERQHVRLTSLTSDKKDSPVRVRLVYKYCKSHPTC
ncbi:hypothetical protein PISMIDRAFT_6459 [Pisolithus microcarpus 441]|uniref:Unplaced genomic scaffold scaffold_3, whole genome shotgun sequence n=1 Tax=Pisolithus microcarpus 441 TaxID=765257 RepID=A0A0D0AE47_9AGAM|nr:hypothetical protein PISMIDRAFT_6459 [Pisolithus microcarpus 441]